MPRHLGSAKLCVSLSVIPVSWLFICLPLCSFFFPVIFPLPSFPSLSSFLLPTSPLPLSLVYHLLSPSQAFILCSSVMLPTRSKTLPLFILYFLCFVSVPCFVHTLFLIHSNFAHNIAIWYSVSWPKCLLCKYQHLYTQFSQFTKIKQNFDLFASKNCQVF